MASEPVATPVNYFSEGSPGKGLKAGVEDEKLKLLRLMAEHGEQGQRIYHEAQSRATQTQGSAVAAATAGPVNVPVGLIQEVATEFDTNLQLFNKQLAASAEEARKDTVRRQSIEAAYKDRVMGDASLEAGAQLAIDAYTARQKAARGGGGGRGGRGGRGTDQSYPITLPESYLAGLPSWEGIDSASLDPFSPEPPRDPRSWIDKAEDFVGGNGGTPSTGSPGGKAPGRPISNGKDPGRVHRQNPQGAGKRIENPDWYM